MINLTVRVEYFCGIIFLSLLIVLSIPVSAQENPVNPANLSEHSQNNVTGFLIQNDTEILPHSSVQPLVQETLTVPPLSPANITISPTIPDSIVQITAPVAVVSTSTAEISPFSTIIPPTTSSNLSLKDSHQKEQVSSAISGKIKYYAYGDSITQANGSEDLNPDGSDCYVIQMRNRYDAVADADHNMDGGGRTSSWGVTNKGTHLASGSADYTFIMFGVNDRAENASYTASETAANLKDMYSYYTGLGSKTFVFIEPMGGFGSGWSTEANQVNNITRMEAYLLDNHIPFLRIYDAIDSTPGNDYPTITNTSYALNYLHPNALGHSVVADYVWERAVTLTDPVASFTGSSTGGIGTVSVQFNDTSSEYPFYWNWSFTNVTGNNTQIWFSTSKNPVKTFGVGNYSIGLNASNSAGYNLSTQVTFINVTPTLVNLTSKIGIYRNGVFYLKKSNSAGNADLAFNYGIPGDRPLVGDWDRNGNDSVGIYRNGAFYLKNSNNAGNADLAFNYGIPGDIPLVGDWNGDGVDTVGIYRNGAFYLKNSNSAGNADMAFNYGLPGDTPLVGDWNGDGADTVGIYRNGAFYLRNSNSAGNADMAFNYGLPGDTPLVGDWDRNGVDTVGIYRNSAFYLRNSNSAGNADLAFGYGIPGDTPLVGIWDGL